MRLTWLGLTALGLTLLVGCGGTTASAPGSGGHAGVEMPGGGANAGTGAKPMPGAPKPDPRGTSGSSGVPPGSICSKVCVNTAAFSIQLDAPLAALEVDALKACRNADECFTGSLPDPGLGGNTISFTANSWDGPSASSQDGWKTIDYRWGSTTPGYLHDGDRFSLSFVRGETEVLVFEQAVTFEVVPDCAGSCLYARYEVQSVDLPVGGAPTTGDAGASFGGAEAGSAGEGGAPSL